MRWFLVVALLGPLSGTAVAQPELVERLKQVQSDPVARKSAIESGKKASFFCANCHGETGVSKSQDVPNLAGQNPDYLLEQIRKFATGERKDQFMQGLIKLLSDDERLQIALFYSNATVVPATADPTSLVQGKAIFEKLCVRCHGPQARGDALVPRLAGQKRTYLATSITRYRDNTGVRNNQLMSIATSTLKTEEISAIANYLSQLP